jgi:hypothetical protein
MSYPAILPTLPSFSPAVRRPSAPASGRHPVRPPTQAAQAGQLVDWLRLAAGRGLLGAGLEERVDPYLACRFCVARVQWCGGCGGGRAGGIGLDGITPLTPTVVLGAMADPYPPAELAEWRTHGLLQRIARLPDALGVALLTRSPRLLRDLDLLAELDQRHAVTVDVLIPAADPELAHRLEPCGTASPADRFDLVRTLSAHGIAARVTCSPILPGLNNSAAALRRLCERAHQAGASDVLPAPRHPALPPTPAESRSLLALFHRLRLEHGFPRTLPGRG